MVSSGKMGVLLIVCVFHRTQQYSSLSVKALVGMVVEDFVPSSSNTCIASAIINTPHLMNAFVKIDEPTLACHHHPTFIVYIRVWSCYSRCTCYASGQMYNEMYSLWYRSTFTGLKILCALWKGLFLVTVISLFLYHICLICQQI